MKTSRKNTTGTCNGGPVYVCAAADSNCVLTHELSGALAVFDTLEDAQRFARGFSKPVVIVPAYLANVEMYDDLKRRNAH